LRGFAVFALHGLLKAPSRTPHGDEVVRARAEAAQQHYGLLLNLCHMTHAASRQARGRPDKSRRGGGEG